MVFTASVEARTSPVPLPEIYERRIDEVAATINREHAKVFSDAKSEASRGREVVEFATGFPHLLKGEYTEQFGAGIDS